MKIKKATTLHKQLRRLQKRFADEPAEAFGLHLLAVYKSGYREGYKDGSRDTEYLQHCGLQPLGDDRGRSRR